MDFFAEKRNYIVCFLLFGLWSKWTNSKTKVVFQVYLIFLMALNIYLFANEVVFGHFYRHSSLSAVVRIYLWVIMLLAFLVIATESLCTSAAQEQLIRKFSIVDRLIWRKMSICVPYQKEKRELFLRNFVIIAIMLFLNVSAAIYSYYTKSIIYSTIYFSWIMRLRVVQVMFFVYLMRGRLSLINDELVDIRRIFNDRVERNQVSDFPINVNTDKLPAINSIYERILTLKRLYKQLHDICELINHTFGWSLLAIFTQSFIAFTSNSYWVFFFLENNINDLGSFMACIDFAIQTTISVCIMAFYCSSCYKVVWHSV